MATLITYIGMNVVLSAILERKSKKTAYIFHAVLFFFTFALLLLVTDDSVLGKSVADIVGEGTYNAVTTVVFGSRLNVMLPLLVVETALLLQTILVALFAVQSITTCFEGSKHKAYQRLSNNTTPPPVGSLTA